MGDSYFYVVSSLSSFPTPYNLNISEGNAYEGAPIIVYPSTGEPNEQWCLDGGLIVSQIITNQVWSLEMNASGQVTLQPVTSPTANQLWTFIDGMIQNQGTGLVLSVDPPLGSATSVTGVAKPEEPSNNVLWQIASDSLPPTPVSFFSYVGSAQLSYSLNISGGEAVAGAQIILYPSWPAANELWYFGENGYIVSSIVGDPGWAIEMDTSGNVTLQLLSSGPNQQWTVLANMIQNIGTGLFLSASGPLESNPNVVGVAEPDVPTSSVLWQVGSEYTPINPVYIFTHLAGSANPYALNISGAQAIAGAQIILYPGCQVNNEQWYLWPGGYLVSIIEAEQGWAMEMDATGNITLQSISNTPNQQWIFTNGMIQNQGTGMVLAVDQPLSSIPPAIGVTTPSLPTNWVLWRVGPYSPGVQSVYIFTNLGSAQNQYALTAPLTGGDQLLLSAPVSASIQFWSFLQASYIASGLQYNGVLWVLDMNAEGTVSVNPCTGVLSQCWMINGGMIQNQETGMVLTATGQFDVIPGVVGKALSQQPQASQLWNLGTTYSGQNKITLAQYDMVIAVTQASVNETLALFLAGLDENIGLYYNIDPSGNLVPAPDRSTADYTFTGTLGYTRDSNGNPVDLVLLYSGKGPRTVTYNITFNNAKFNSTVQPAFDYRQEKGSPWIVSFSVDLAAANVAMSELPPATQDAIGAAANGLDFDSFCIQQLYLDLNTAVFDRFQNIAGVPEDDNAAQILSAIMKAYLADLQSASGVIFGYNLQATVLNSSSPTLLPTAVDFCVTPYTDPFGNYSNSSLDTLNYLIMVSGNPMPSEPPLSFDFNWVNTPDIQGSIAVSSGIYLPYLIGQLNGILQTISPVCYVQIDPSNDIDNQTMQLNPGLSSNTFETISPPAGGTIAMYSYTSPPATASASGIEYQLSLSLTYCSSCTVAIQGTTITLAGQSTVSADIDSTVGRENVDTQMLPATYAWSVDLVLSMDLVNSGQIDYSIQNAKFDSAPTVAPENESGWQKFLQDMSGQLQVFVSDPGNIRETLNTQVLNQIQQVLVQGVNSSNQFIFPGGGTFLFKNPTFTDTLDLTANITYQSPA